MLQALGTIRIQFLQKSKKKSCLCTFNKKFLKLITMTNLKRKTTKIILLNNSEVFTLIINIDTIRNKNAPVISENKISRNLTVV